MSPGSYIVKIDAAQLHKLEMTSSPIALPVNILKNKDGDVVDGLEFVLHSLRSDTSAGPLKLSEQKTVPLENPAIVKEKVIPLPLVTNDEKSAIVKKK